MFFDNIKSFYTNPLTDKVNSYHKASYSSWQLKLTLLPQNVLHLYNGCTLETFEINEEHISSEPVQKLIRDTLLAQNEVKLKRKVNSQREKYLSEKREYERLKEKFKNE